MRYEQWLEILGKVNADIDLDKDNIIEKIKEGLKVTRPYMYNEWKEGDFDVNWVIGSEKCTLLHLASGEGYKKVVEALIESGADVNKTDKEKITPLYSAAYRNHKEVVQVLLNNKVNVDVVGKYRMTPLHWAAHNGEKDIVEALIQRGANVNAVDEDGRAPLHFAFAGGHLEIIKYLIGEEKVAPDVGNNSSLHVTAEKKDEPELNSKLNELSISRATSATTSKTC